MASGTSASGYVLSITGVSFSVSSKPFKSSIESFLSGIDKAMPGNWLTNGESATSLRTRGMLPNQRPAPFPKHSHHRAALTIGLAGGLGVLPIDRPRRTEAYRDYHDKGRPRSKGVSNLFGSVRQALTAVGLVGLERPTRAASPPPSPQRTR